MDSRSMDLYWNTRDNTLWRHVSDVNTSFRDGMRGSFISRTKITYRHREKVFDLKLCSSFSTKTLHDKARRIAEKAVAVADVDERVNRAVITANRAANAARVAAVKAVQNRMHAW
ncbi:hypothetical protein L1987_17465 [Smallanthus sonchifolius]|uniref:Uncharacterized protein n=1 Tax=Smallanthus sonchifolius TaxID=185202 RepID=A0ACB9IWZ7_9ASTR|nr:hypothetical protein L1987_17465 [Smallanthus sonchifolius]